MNFGSMVADVRAAEKAGYTVQLCPFCKGWVWVAPEDDRVYCTARRCEAGRLAEKHGVMFASLMYFDEFGLERKTY